MSVRNEGTVGGHMEKYLTFDLSGEVYGIDILRIREIIGVMEITPVPHTPECVKGVMNLRGKIIPVVDLRLRFGMDPIDYTERTCVIFVEFDTSKGVVAQVGLVVDAVSEVAQISPGDIEPPPAMGESLDTGYLRGMAKMKEKVVILLDIAKVLGEGLGGFFAAA